MSISGQISKTHPSRRPQAQQLNLQQARKVYLHHYNLSPATHPQVP